MDKVLFVAGPTSSGKTKLALELASKFNGEIVSCDSIQVYQGLDIVSGKDLPLNSTFVLLNNELSNISKKFNVGYYLVESLPIYLLDLVKSTYNFNVSDYLEVSLPIIGGIVKKGKLPVVVGGTGFYLKALLDGIETLQIPQNQKLRKNLEIKKVEELAEILKKENYQRFIKMNESDIKNKRRLIRAIEVSKYLKEDIKEERFIKKLENADVLVIGLKSSGNIIKQKIDERIKKRLQNDALGEVEGLFSNYKSLSSQVKLANGYKELFDYYLKKVSLEQAIINWAKAEYHNAKKQMTFFKKDKRIQWFDISETDFKDEVERTVENWLKTGMQKFSKNLP